VATAADLGLDKRFRRDRLGRSSKSIYEDGDLQTTQLKIVYNAHQYPFLPCRNHATVRASPVTVRGNSLLAAVYFGQRDVRVQEWLDPPPPGVDDIQLEILRAAICGTDVDEFTGGPRLVPLHKPHLASGHVGPLVLGHEMVGKVVAVGAEVEGITVGDRVVPGSGVWCGRCRWCSAGRTNLCAGYYTVGLHVDGGLAERVNVPARICLLAGTCPDDVAVMAQPLAVALHAMRGTGVRPGMSAAVIGAGGIGSLVIAACAVRGINPIAVDVSAARLRTAERLGASLLVDSTNEDAAATVRQTTGEGVDIVIECSGSAAGLDVAMKSVCRGGLIQLVGLHRDATPLDLTRLVLDEIRISTSKVHICEQDLPAALTILQTYPHIASETLHAVIDLPDVVSAGLTRMAAGEVTGKILVNP
jgi:(R,R)-butanediol dehydrogenase/meso-butanediol dehydrogenase/diacetyl reductase